MGILFVNPVNGLIARVCHFFRIFGKLDFGDEIPVFVLDGRQLVNAAEGWAVLGGNQAGAYAPGSDFCPLRL